MLILGIFILFWYLPRLIDLQQIPGDVPVAEGPVNGEGLQLSLDYRKWQKGEGSASDEDNNFYLLVLLGALVVLVSAFIVFLMS